MLRSYWVPIFAAVGWLTGAFSSQAKPPIDISSNQYEASVATQQNNHAEKVQSWHPYFIDWLSAKLGVTGCGPYSMDRLGYAQKINKDDYYKDCDLEAQESTSNSTRWLLLLAGLQTILAVFGTILVWRSLKLNRDAVNAAVEANRNTLSAIEQEHSNAKKQLRAYVLPDGGVIDFTNVNLPTITIGYKNFGQTPAHHVTITLRGGVGYYPLTVELPARENVPEKGLGVLAPQQVMFHDITFMDAITPDLLAKIEQGSVAIYVFGVISYIDAFKDEQTTKYRWLFSDHECKGVVAKLEPDNQENEAT